MTVATPTTPAPTGSTTTGSSTPRPSRARRRRWLFGGLLAFAVIVLAVVFATQGTTTSTAPLDPDNPRPPGAQALARVLAEQGVDVTVARNQAELERADLDGSTTVFVATTANLSRATAGDLTRLTTGAAKLVVVTPRAELLRVLAPRASVADDRRTDLVASGCAPAIRDGESISRSQVGFSAPGASATCFTRDGRSAYLELPRSGRTAPIVLFGSRTAMANEEITDEANAAVLLRMLGATPRLVWYVPDRADNPPTSNGATESPVPRWLGPAVLLLAFAVLALMLWRGRRLGRLVTEPLPVVVRAIETTQSRGRLYRRARDAPRAGAILQDASRRRLGSYLGLPPSVPVHTLVYAVAASAGRPTDEVGSLLAGPPPADDAGLLALARQLATLEEEVHRP